VERPFLTRVSVQGYNEPEDVERLATALSALPDQ
jgi:selenocysteine lyase/cysteine desulfurase